MLAKMGEYQGENISFYSHVIPGYFRHVVLVGDFSVGCFLSVEYLLPAHTSRTVIFISLENIR